MFSLRGKKKLSVTALGGVDRVGGANCYLLETPDSRIMLDCGCALVPRAGGLLEENIKRIDYPHFERVAGGVGLILLSHSHLDHIGALPHFLNLLGNGRKPQVMASELTLKIVQGLFNGCWSNTLFEEKRLLPDGIVQSDDINVLPIGVSHSVPQSLGFYLELSGKKIFYPGDFKLNSPYYFPTEFLKESLSALARKKIDILFLDSSNIDEEGFCPSEEVVWRELTKIISQARGRIIFSTFSSHVERLEAVIQIAKSYHRPVYVTGRNLIDYLNAGGVQGWIRLDPQSAIALGFDDALILTTGCQAESRSGLVNAIFGEAAFRLREQDTVVIAADPIPVPENVGRVKEMVERLTRMVKTVYISQKAPADFSPRAKRAGIHESGHEKKEGLLDVAREVSPKLVIPIHGDREKRQRLASLVEREGIEAKIIETAVPFEV